MDATWFVLAAVVIVGFPLLCDFFGVTGDWGSSGKQPPFCERSAQEVVHWRRGTDARRGGLADDNTGSGLHLGGHGEHGGDR